jgi:hypothetical protein
MRLVGLGALALLAVAVAVHLQAQAPPPPSGSLVPTPVPVEAPPVPASATPQTKGNPEESQVAALRELLEGLEARQPEYKKALQKRAELIKTIQQLKATRTVVDDVLEKQRILEMIRGFAQNLAETDRRIRELQIAHLTAILDRAAQDRTDTQAIQPLLESLDQIFPPPCVPVPAPAPAGPPRTPPGAPVPVPTSSS